MPNRVLVPYAGAARLVASKSEPAVPGWPGTVIPNFSEWRPGDIVLVRHAPGKAGLLLGAGQALSRRAVSRQGWEWTHAGLYIGGDQMVEAAFGLGVVQTPLWKYCQYRALCVRRLSAPFTDVDGVKASIEAIRHVGQPYSWQEVVRSKLIPATEPRPSRYYCSTFVGLAINSSTGFSIYGKPRQLPLHPSSLAADPDLDDVDVEWRHMQV